MALNHELVKRIWGEENRFSFNAAATSDAPSLKMNIQDLNVSYGHGLSNAALSMFRRHDPDNHSIHERKNRNHALQNVSLPVYENEVLALIGASGCGKSTFIRALNRTNEEIAGCITTGRITLDGTDIYDRGLDLVELRKKVGIIAQKPNPFAKSIHENVAYGIRLHGLASKRGQIDDLVEEYLSKVGLFDEVKDEMKKEGRALSGGQQQRLCIARTMATEPEVILMDEPCASLDPISTQRVEDCIAQLRKDYTVIIITHNLSQAARVSQRVAHFHLGELKSYGKTQDIFESRDDEKSHEKTRQFLTGRFG